MFARFGASRRACAECQDCALAGVEQEACGSDLEPRLRRRLRAEWSPRHVNHDLLGTIVSQLDRSRARRRECEPCG